MIVYFSIGALVIITGLIFYLLRKLNKSIEAFTFMVGKFAEINQDIYTKQTHINKTMATNLEKHSKQITELASTRKDIESATTIMTDAASNSRKLIDDVNSANRKYTDNINTVVSKLNKVLSDTNKRKQ